MEKLFASRRGFITNLIILTSGTVLGNSITNIPPKKVNEIEQIWNSFCQLQAGKNYRGTLTNKKDIIPCCGHRHVDGKLICFSEINIIAEPVWIYWKCNPNQPSDLVVNFYKEDGSAAYTLNRYEIEFMAEKLKNANEERDRVLSFLKSGKDSLRAEFAKNSIKRQKTSTNIYV